MYNWIIRISGAVVGVVLLVMVRSLEWYPIFYAAPLMMILFAFLNCGRIIEFSIISLLFYYLWNGG